MTNEYAPPILPGCSVLPPLQPRPPRPIRDNTDDTEGNGERTRKGSAKRTAAGQRFKTLNAFVDCSLAELSRAEALTWLVLFRDTRDGTARTSATDIARRIGTSRRAVTDALASLRRRGLLTLLYRGGINRGVSVHRVNSLSNRPGG